ncbi:MAG: hypothetical protein AAFR61_31685, partial [Bacteroidota bacterium]
EVLWEGGEINITSLFDEMGKNKLEFVVDLSSSLYIGRATLKLTFYPAHMGPDGVEYAAGRDGSPQAIPLGAAQKTVCIRNNCSLPTGAQHPCRCTDTWRTGFMVGQQQTSFIGTNNLNLNAAAFNAENKFAGIYVTSPGEKLYFQGELLASTTNFSQTLDSTFGSDVGDVRSWQFIYVHFTPLHVRYRVHPWVSIGAGGSLAFIFRAEEDGQNVVNFDSNRDARFRRNEPEAFVDVQIGNVLWPVFIGGRFGKRWGTVETVTGTSYNVGKIYIGLSF